MAENEMPVDVGAKLVRHGVLKPARWPKFEVIEKAIKAKRGIYWVEQGSATVNIYGTNGYGSADQANVALALALIDALDKTFPQLAIEQKPLEVNPVTGEIPDVRDPEIEQDNVELAKAIEEIRAKDDAEFDRDPEAIAKAFSAKGDGVEVVYDPEIGAYRTAEGDIYQAGTVEDAVGVGR